MTSAFIIQVGSQLQQDPNEETAALLRVILYQLNKTAFDGNVPPVPKWSGPPRTIVQVQAILYASLAASLFAAFLAVLGKQWLNRYASIDMRGSAIERSQNRQRKLDGIVTWYFDHVMEALPVMLQFALLLLGCALSRYIWGINTAVASVVIGATSFTVICYGFITVAGTASASCPYQTPGAQILRYLWKKVSNHSAFHPGPEQVPDREATALDFHCVLWMLQTSLDRKINELTLRYLASILVPPGFKTTIVADCFKMLISSVSVTGEDLVVVLPGSEGVAEAASTCLLGSLSHSLITDPTSDILEDVEKQFGEIFSPTVNLQNLPFYHTISAVHNLINKHDHPSGLNWKGIDPSAPGSLSLAHNLVKIAWLQHRSAGEHGQRVPRWVLNFSLHSLLRDPKPPASVLADCLLIIAIDLGCNISESDVRTPDKRYVYMVWQWSLSS